MRRGHTVHVLAGHPGSADLLEEDRFDEYDFEGIHVYRFLHAYAPMAGQVSMIEIGYNNRLADSYFGRILERFKPEVVHFFHLNRLGTGLIEVAARVGVRRFMTPTDFWAICPTGQLVCDDGSLCAGPSAYAGNCVKHLAQRTQGGLTRIIARKLPTASVDLLARLTQKGVLTSYPHQVEVKAISSRLTANIRRLNQLNGILAPNRFMREKLVQYGVSPHLIIQSAFGIDVPDSSENLSRHTPRRPLVVGYIGTLATHKGCHVLIEAFKRLPLGQAILKIYGNLEDFPEYSRELKRHADNSDAITFCGIFPNSKIGKVLADLDVLVVPSLWYENTPLVVYSAQAARCPVVASDFPGISEVVRDEVDGLMFEAGNPKALAKQLSRLIDEPGITERLSTNSQQPKSTRLYVDEMLSLWKSA